MKTLLAEALPSAVAIPETDSLNERVRATWMSGDFGRIAKGYERSAAEFIARLGLTGQDSVLVVACGTGNLTLPAARGGSWGGGAPVVAIASAREPFAPGVVSLLE